VLKDKVTKAFTEAFLERYLPHGFGSMPKREIDVLLFNLISSIEQIKGNPNYRHSVLSLALAGKVGAQLQDIGVDVRALGKTNLNAKVAYV
jgi:hypothetical protein